MSDDTHLHSGVDSGLPPYGVSDTHESRSTEELRKHVRDLKAALSNQQNMLTTAGVASLVLDRDAKIVQFSPPAGDLLRLHPGHLGRAVYDCDHPLVRSGDLQAAFDKALRSKFRQEETVAGGGNQRFARVLQPCCPDGHRVETVVLELREVSDPQEPVRTFPPRARDAAGFSAVAYRCDAGLRCTWMLNHSSRLTGHEPSTPTHDESTDPRRAKPIVRLERQVLKSGVPGCVEYMRDIDGEKRVWEAYAEPERSKANEITGLNVIALDVTERKRTEHALRKSEEFFRLALVGGRAGAWEWNMDTGEVVWNPELYQILGVDTDQKPNVETFLKLVHPDDRANVRQSSWKQLKKGKSYSAEYRIVRPDGQIRWLWSIGRMVGDTSPAHVYGLTFDITSRKQTEQALRQSEERFRRVLDGAPNPLLVYADDGEILYVNNCWEERTGYSREYLKSIDGWTARAYGSAKDEMTAFLLELFANNKTACFESAVIRKDGRRRTLLFTCASVGVQADGRKVRALSGVDISDRKNMEDKLTSLTATLEQRVKQQMDEAEQRMHQLRALALELTRAEQNERKRIADVLHNNLQQLIASAVMRLARLRNQVAGEEEKALVGETKQLLRDVVEQTRHLSTELHPPVLHHFGLGAALEWLAQTMQSEQGIHVDLDLEEDADPQSEELRAFFFESAREFLFNVKKHAQVDRARLTLRSRYNELILRVEDDGVGCDTQEMRKRARNNAAFGLFSISERLELLGGAFDFRNNAGGGCCVEIRVPTDMPPPQTETPLPQDYHLETGGHPASRGDIIRILLADDHHIVREGLRNILEDQSAFKVIGEAPDGRKALELVRELRPDVVITDISMPKMNGIEATKRIKREFPDIHVIGLSVIHDQGTANAVKRAGACDYLLKDCPSEALFDAIWSAVRAEPQF